MRVSCGYKKRFWQARELATALINARTDRPTDRQLALLKIQQKHVFCLVNEGFSNFFLVEFF